MRLILIVFVATFYSFLINAQPTIKYEFNNRADSILYSGITNVLYVKKGTPISRESSVRIKKIQRKKYAVEIDNSSQEKIDIYIMDEVSNPETNESENVVVDKIPVKIIKDTLEVEICIGNNNKEIYFTENIELSLCTNIDCDLKIVSYSLVINKELFEAIGSKFNDKIREAIKNTDKNTSIQVEVVYKDVLNNKKKLISLFEKK